MKESSEAAVAGGSVSEKGGASRPQSSSDAPFAAASGAVKSSRNASLAHMQAAVAANQEIVRAFTAEHITPLKSRNSSIPPELSSLLESLQSRLAAAEGTLAHAMAEKKSTSSKPRAKTPTKSQIYHAIQGQADIHGPIASLFSVAVPGKTTAAFESKLRRSNVYDSEEKRATKYSIAIEAEEASQESTSGPLFTSSGKLFVVPDGHLSTDEDDELDDSTSSNGNGSMYAPSFSPDMDRDAQDSSEIQAAIRSIIMDFRSRHPDMFDSTPPKGHVDILLEQDAPGIHVLSLLLNSWINRPDFSTIHIKDFILFIKALRGLPLEFCREVFRQFATAFIPRSIVFVRFIYRLVTAILPQQAELFAEQIYKRNKEWMASKAASREPPRTMAFAPSADKVPSMVTARVLMPSGKPPKNRAPIIKDISDVKAFFHAFLTEYERYSRTFIAAGFEYLSIFECFTTTQQLQFAALSRLSAAECAALTNEALVERLRILFGIQSMAAAIAALKNIKFDGDVMTPNSWLQYHRLYIDTLCLASSTAVPDPQSTCKLFIQGCPLPFMRDLLIMRKIPTVDAALSTVIDLLQNADFLRAVAEHRGKAPKIAGIGHSHGQGQGQSQGHGNGGNGGNGGGQPPGQGGAVRRQHTPGLTFTKSGQAPQRQPAPNPTQAEVKELCKRCGKPGHFAKDCICVTHADGHTLDTIPQDEYDRRRQRLKEKNKASRQSQGGAAATPPPQRVAMVLMGAINEVHHTNTFETSLLPTAPKMPSLGTIQRKAASPPSSIQSDSSYMDGVKAPNKRKVKQKSIQSSILPFQTFSPIPGGNFLPVSSILGSSTCFDITDPEAVMTALEQCTGLSRYNPHATYLKPLCHEIMKHDARHKRVTRSTCTVDILPVIDRQDALIAIPHCTTVSNTRFDRIISFLFRSHFIISQLSTPKWIALTFVLLFFVTLFLWRLLLVGIEMNPGPGAARRLVFREPSMPALISDSDSDSSNVYRPSKSAHAKHSDSESARSEKDTPPRPITFRSVAAPVLPKSDMSGMPALCSDSDTSDSDCDSKAPIAAAAHKVVLTPSSHKAKTKMSIQSQLFRTPDRKSTKARASEPAMPLSDEAAGNSSPEERQWYTAARTLATQFNLSPKTTFLLYKSLYDAAQADKGEANLLARATAEIQHRMTEVNLPWIPQTTAAGVKFWFYRGDTSRVRWIDPALFNASPLPVTNKAHSPLPIASVSQLRAEVLLNAISTFHKGKTSPAELSQFETGEGVGRYDHLDASVLAALEIKQINYIDDTTFSVTVNDSEAVNVVCPIATLPSSIISKDPWYYSVLAITREQPGHTLGHILSSAAQQNPGDTTLLAGIAHAAAEAVDSCSDSSIHSSDDQADSDDDMANAIVNSLNHFSVEQPVTSDPCSSSDENPFVAAINTNSDLLEPPKIIGLVGPPNSAPLNCTAVECSLDTMCTGKSVISKNLAVKLNLPRASCDISAYTADGKHVHCTELALFSIHIHINDAWFTIQHEAMMWEHTCTDLLLSHQFITSTGTLDLCRDNDERIRLFGRICFSKRWRQLLDQRPQEIAAAYYENVLSREDEEDMDILLPILKWGQQDASKLEGKARDIARMFPNFLLPIPKFADSRLYKIQYHVDLSQLATYSFPKVILDDLKEEKLSSRAQLKLRDYFKKLDEAHFTQPVSAPPVGVACRATLIPKPPSDDRFTINGSIVKKMMYASLHPMPRIRSILEFVAKFPFRVRLDLKHGYHNFDLHPDSIRYTITIGAGVSREWRKGVQGLSATCSEFQFGMEQMLGDDILYVMAAVYFDDLIIVGETAAACEQNMLIVLRKLYDHNFRLNLAKCEFVPTTRLAFLGHELDGTLVRPGPKVNDMLSRIKDFWLQPTEKQQQSHLYHFLGCCAFLNDHCPRLKPTLGPLYDIVAKKPFAFAERHKEAFKAAMSQLLELQPYHLPSDDPAYRTEIATDASGGLQGPNGDYLETGNWAAVLGQRRGIPNPIFNEGFELLQCTGGTFSKEQGKWPIPVKEMKAIQLAFVKFGSFIRGRKVLLITDSKILLHCYRSSNLLIQRWYSFIAQFDFDIIHWPSESNALCDALTRCVIIHAPSPSAPTIRAKAKQPARVSVCPVLPASTPAAPTEASADAPIQISDSSDDKPMVAPATTRAQAAPLSSPEQPVNLPAAAPQAPLRRRNHRVSFDAAPDADGQEATPAIPAASHRGRRKRSKRQPASPQAVEEEQAQAAEAADDQGNDDDNADVLSYTLVKHTVPEGSNSFIVAMSEALLHDNGGWAQLRAVLPPSPPCIAEKIRETVCDFMHEHGLLLPLDVLDGETCEKVFHKAYRQRRAADRGTLIFQGEDIEVDSWRNYCQLLRDPQCNVDALFIKTAAALYECQIVILDANFDVMMVTPMNAYRRIFLNVDENAFAWSHVPHNECDDPTCVERPVVSVAINIPPTIPMDFRPEFDDGQPYTVISVRLFDGSNAQTPINNDCTVGHLYAEVAVHAPGATFTLVTGPADTPLLDKSATLTSVNLIHNRAAVKQIALKFPATRLSISEPLLDITAERYAILQRFHNGFTGHFGVDATHHAMKMAGHDWRYMRANIQQFISRCRNCMLSRTRHIPAGTFHSTLRKTDKPFMRWHADMTGRYITCRSTGFAFIILFVDEVTGTINLYGSRARCALEVAIALVQLCGFYGPIEAFHSDGGGEFDANVIHQFIQITAMKHTISIAHNPNTNGVAERNIQTVKRVFRQLILDIGKYEHWGLHLPVIQWAVNSSYRQSLGCSPNEFLFPTYAQRTEAIIPVGIVAPTRINQAVSADLNAYGVSANYIHHVKSFQESVLARLSQLRNAQLTAAAAEAAIPPESLTVGTLVLIPWNWTGAPDPTLPLMRGPYIIDEKDPHSNVMLLKHVQFPPPREQPMELRWSAHAHAYPVDLPDRSELDPSASQSVPFSTPHPIEFILDHRHPSRWPAGAASQNPKHVVNYEYHVQFLNVPKTHVGYRQWLPYDHVKHTMSFDNYMVTCPELEGHIPIANMPANWDPHAPNYYPNHPPVAMDEYQLRFDDDPMDPP